MTFNYKYKAWEKVYFLYKDQIHFSEIKFRRWGTYSFDWIHVWFRDDQVFTSVEDLKDLIRVKIKVLEELLLSDA